MSVGIGFDELLDWSDHERAKWKAWIEAEPGRLDMTFQPGGRFPTVWALLEHVFFVERRHLSRMEGAVPPDASGIPPGDWRALFEYADLVRADFREFLARLSAADAAGAVTFSLPSASFSIARRRLSAHVLLHEARHLAQLAHTARLAGMEPPGNHDYLFFPAAHEAPAT